MQVSMTNLFLLMLAFTTPFFWAPCGWAQEVEVNASLDRPQAAVGDVVNLAVSISSKNSVQIEEPNLGNLQGFELLNTSTGFETRSSFENGSFVTQQSRRFNFMLAVAKQGQLTIPPVKIVVNGKEYRTKPISFAATEARPDQQRGRGRGQPQQDPLAQMDDMEELFQQMLQRRFRGFPNGQGRVDPQEQVNPNDAFFIQVETDKKKAYVGEQITTTFYLYTRGQIRDIDTLKYPDLKGFWKEDLEMATRLNFEGIVVNGVPYQRALLVSYALFPISPGRTTIDSYKAKCTVLTASSFGFGRPLQVTKLSPPVNIEVLAVPSEGQPGSYTGAVGKFRVTAAFEPTTGTVGQPVTLRIRFEGQGNAKLIELPPLNLPAGFELYDQKSQAKYLKDGSSFKEFDVMILPRQPGVFELPPVSVAVFDPESRKFSTISSQPLRLTVTGTALPEAPSTAVAEKDDKANVQDGKPQLLPLATQLSEGSSRTSTGLWLSLLMLVASMAWVGWEFYRAFYRRPKKQSLVLLLQRRLKKARELANKREWRPLGVELTNAAYQILGQVSAEGGASEELARLLERAPPSIRNELAVPIQQVLSQCEALSFAPETLIGSMVADGKIDKLFEDFERTLSRAIELAEI